MPNDADSSRKPEEMNIDSVSASEHHSTIKSEDRVDKEANKSDDAATARVEPESGGQSWLPSLPTAKHDSVTVHQDPLNLTVGEIYRDFLILRELGRGAFGVVYFAEQVSLRRSVALKITDLAQGSDGVFEGQTLAQLEHPSIVRVYSQSTDEANGRRLLCMQYVSGMNLRALMHGVKKVAGEQWQGKHLLVELTASEDEPLAPGERLSNRDELAELDKFNTVCRFGVQLADALVHAHDAGFVHRDIKPENTIVNQVGRPMLVDFNLAMATQVDNYVAGGTVPYMSPESIQAFVTKEVNPQSTVRSDIYSLGVMLWELATDALPFDRKVESLRDPEQLALLLQSRSETPQGREKLSVPMANALYRAFHPSAEERYESATDFREALLGITKQKRVEQVRSNTGLAGRLLKQFPIVWLILAALVPHVIASGLQIAYNQAEIIGDLQLDRSRQLFHWLLFVANPVLYGICIAWCVWKLINVLRPWLLATKGEGTAAQLTAARSQLLKFPMLITIIGCIGWLGGVLAFPTIIYFLSERFGGIVWMHFICSFAISGAIAATFSYGLTMAVVIFGLYPNYFTRPEEFWNAPKSELHFLHRTWERLPLLGGVIPLVAAVLVVATIHPEELSQRNEVFAFKALVIGLLAASASGFLLLRKTGSVMRKLVRECSR